MYCGGLPCSALPHMLLLSTALCSCRTSATSCCKRLRSCRTSTTGKQLMLNSDMSLIKDVFAGSGKDSGEPACSYDACPASATLAIVQEYATDNALFVKEFVLAYAKMLTKGHDVCALEVVPSKGSGPDVEQLYGVAAVKQGCGALVPASEPTTSGVFDDPAAVGAPAAAPASGTAAGATTAGSTAGGSGGTSAGGGGAEARGTEIPGASSSGGAQVESSPPGGSASGALGCAKQLGLAVVLLAWSWAALQALL